METTNPRLQYQPNLVHLYHYLHNGIHFHYLNAASSTEKKSDYEIGKLPPSGTMSEPLFKWGERDAADFIKDVEKAYEPLPNGVKMFLSSRVDKAANISLKLSVAFSPPTARDLPWNASP